MLFRKIGLALLLVVAIAGCNSEKFRNAIDQRSNEASRGMQDVQQQGPKKTYNPLVVSDKVWAGNSATRLHRGAPLPEKFENPRGVALVSSEPMKLNEIISIISGQTGIPMRISASGDTQGQGQLPQDSSSNQSSRTPGMTLAYEGSLSGLLDQVCSYFGVNWKYDGASVNISRYETRVFVLETLPGTQKISDGIKQSESSNTSSGSRDSSSDLSQSSEMEVEIKVWDDLNQTITSILGGVGSVVTAPSSGTVTVTTTPEIMRTVAKYIGEENRRLSRQVAVNVEIYSVSLAEGSDFQVTLDAAFKKIRDTTMTLTSPHAPNDINGGGVLNTMIANSGTNGSYSNPILTALQSVGDTARVAQFPLITLNNRPVTRRIGHEIAYLKSSETTTSTNVGSTTTMEPGTIHEGFSLQVTPRVLEDGRVMLQYSFSLVDRVSITTLTATGDNSSMVQLPETIARVFVQQSVLKSGSTLIIGGYDDEVTAQDSQGVGNPFFYWLGGGYNNSKTRAMMFIAITPQVMDVPRVEQE